MVSVACVLEALSWLSGVSAKSLRIDWWHISSKLKKSLFEKTLQLKNFSFGDSLKMAKVTECVVPAMVVEAADDSAVSHLSGSDSATKHAIHSCMTCQLKPSFHGLLCWFVALLVCYAVGLLRCWVIKSWFTSMFCKQL